MDDEKLLKNLVQDKNFMSKILAMSTPEEVQKAFKDKDIDLTLSEIKEFGKVLSMAVKNKGELPDDALTVSGGLKTWHKIAIAGITGLAAAGGVGLAAYEGYKHRDIIKGWFGGEDMSRYIEGYARYEDGDNFDIGCDDFPMTAYGYPNPSGSSKKST